MQDGAVRGKVAANRGWGGLARFAACRDARVMSSLWQLPQKSGGAFSCLCAREFDEGGTSEPWMPSRSCDWLDTRYSC